MGKALPELILAVVQAGLWRDQIEPDSERTFCKRMAPVNLRVQARNRSEARADFGLGGSFNRISLTWHPATQFVFQYTKGTVSDGRVCDRSARPKASRLQIYRW